MTQFRNDEPIELKLQRQLNESRNREKEMKILNIEMVFKVWGEKYFDDYRGGSEKGAEVIAVCENESEIMKHVDLNKWFKVTYEPREID